MSIHGYTWVYMSIHEYTQFIHEYTQGIHASSTQAKSTRLRVLSKGNNLEHFQQACFDVWLKNPPSLAVADTSHTLANKAACTSMSSFTVKPSVHKEFNSLTNGLR